MQWVTYGNEIRAKFYGTADTLDKESLLYVILNLSVKGSNGQYSRLWQPKLDALVPDGYTTEE